MENPQQQFNVKTFQLSLCGKTRKKCGHRDVAKTVDREAVGRMVSIHPKSGDIFYLRVLLNNRAGALSYEDLRTIEDGEHPDYKSVCIALDLSESDKQWVGCLNEAVFMSVPRSI